MDPRWFPRNPGRRNTRVNVGPVSGGGKQAAFRHHVVASRWPAPPLGEVKLCQAPWGSSTVVCRPPTPQC